MKHYETIRSVPCTAALKHPSLNTVVVVWCLNAHTTANICEFAEDLEGT